MSLCTSAHPDPDHLKVKAACVPLRRYSSPSGWAGNSRKHIGSPVCVCLRVCRVGSCATDWYHKWTIGWKVPQCQMKGRINRRGAELRWAPGSASGEIRWENNREGSLVFRGREGGVADREVGLMRCRRVVGDWMISSRELAAFPAKFPILWREARKAILIVRGDIRIRKMGAAGSAKHNLPSHFPFNSLLHYSTFDH